MSCVTRATSSLMTLSKTAIQGLIDISLRYGSRGEPIITVSIVSRPGRRVYRGASDLPRPLAGLGIYIVSTIVVCCLTDLP